MQKPTCGIRAKLITIFVLIKVIPLVALALFAWKAIVLLGDTVETRTSAMVNDSRRMVQEVGGLAVDDSIKALDLRSREAIERLTTDTARSVAAFLYDRDRDARQASSLEPDAAAYRAFLATHTRPVVSHAPWKINDNGTAWIPAEPEAPRGPIVTATVDDNRKDFHSRPPEAQGIVRERPLFLEMTFVDLNGHEKIKVTTSDLLPKTLQDVSRRENTWCRAETYFKDLAALGPDDLYVSRVIGPYLPSPIIGKVTPSRAAARDIPFEPEKYGYAGKENPVGKRFQGIVRWAAPVYRDGRRIGYVTLALDHTHIMEFTDHVVPTEERYSPIADASSGNYAFMWDFEDRCISHARDYFIVGYDPATGELATPWLDSEIYAMWRQSGKPLHEFLPTAPVFLNPSLDRKPAADLTNAGMVGLHCRYLDFAPQCAGWHNVTQHGGSGSFVIFWSGLWKLTTAASIPYHTGQYSSPKGFGYVTIGANVHEFHRAATETAGRIATMQTAFEKDLDRQKTSTLRHLDEALNNTYRDLTSSTVVMIVIVIVIAVMIASSLSRRITSMIAALRAFQRGDTSRRIAVRSRDEMGQLASAFNEMCDSVIKAMNDMRTAEGMFRTIFENAVEGIFQSLPSGRFPRVNPTMARLFGYDSPEEFVDAITDIRQDIYVQPSQRDTYLRLLRQDKEIRGFEAEFRRKDGSTFWALLNARGVFAEDGSLLYTEGSVLDITDQRAARHALQRAKEEAEDANRMKSDFLSMVSHELRTPLTSVLGFAKIIRKRLTHAVLPALVSADTKALKAGEQSLDNLDVIVAEGERLTALINDVLDLTKLEAGKVDWNIIPVSLADIMDRAVAGMRILARQKGLLLRADINGALPKALADQDRLIQVLINLLSNAIKFTAHGSVDLMARQTDDTITISVADTGTGISATDQQRVFDRFLQLGEVLTDKPSGTGLGLAICREIVERLGGRIWVESELGKGSTFFFTLPIAPGE
ncbi:MAG: ATP-binding protein [Desulfovibrionaceae bacterium]